MIIQTNVSALYAQRETSKMNKASERLSSGYKINRAADNVAGLSISEKMRGQMRGLIQAEANVQDGITLIQTAEGAMGDIEAVLHRVRELSVQAANDTYTNEDKECINQEVQTLLSEVDRIAESTEYNTMKILNGEWSETQTGKAVSVEKVNEYYDPDPGGIWITSYEIDLSNIQDGAIIEIDGVKFELDLDGNLFDNTAIQVDMKEITNKERGKRLLTALQNSTLSGRYDDINGTLDEDLPLELILVAFDTDVPDHELISHPSPGKPGKPLNIQLGPSSGESLEMYVAQVTTDALGIDDLSVLNSDLASNAIALSENALGWLSNARAALGAIQNRLEHAVNHINQYEENLSGTESKIRDADMAKEVTQYHKSNMLVQTSHTMQVQSEKAVDGVLKLLE